MDSSRYSDDSFTTVEDQNTEKNAIEGVNEQPFVPASPGPEANGIEILQSSHVSKDGPPASCCGKKRLRFALSEDSDESQSTRETICKSPVKKKHRSILTTKGVLRADLMVERMDTLAKRNYDLEARVEALESATIRLLDSFKEWAEQTEKFMKRKDVERDGPRKWLLWHCQYLERKKIDWATQAKDIYLQSGGFRNRD